MRLGLREVKGGKQAEVFVDEALHSDIAKVLLDGDIEKRKKKRIILLTGDGNGNSNQNSFPLLVEAAIRKKFLVDIFAWKLCCSQVYVKMEAKYAGQLKIYYFDDFKDVITFRTDTEDDEFK